MTTASVGHSRLQGAIERFRDATPTLPVRSRLSGERDWAILEQTLTELAEDLALIVDQARTILVALGDRTQILSRLTTQLWDAMQAIRLVPARGLFRKLERVVRDAARSEGRSLEVITRGDDTALDRSILEHVFNPMLHLVRNAVAHGLEPDDVRRAAGKPGAGRITLEVRQEGSAVVLTVEDDGRGLDEASIASKARQLGLIGPDEPIRPERLHSLIFAPGFSTRSVANAVAGRGIGLDVVAQDVSRLRGTIDLCTRPGRGTRFTLRLPARSSLEWALVFRVAGQCFAIPLGEVDRAEVLDTEAAPPIACARMVRVQDRELPLVDARRALGFSTTPGGVCSRLLIANVAGERLRPPGG